MILILKSKDAAAAGNITMHAYYEDHEEIGNKGFTKLSNDNATKEEATLGIIESAFEKGKEMSKELEKFASKMFNDILEKHGSRGKIALVCFFLALVAGLLIICFFIFRCI